ncbi:MAG: aspartate racemase [Bacteroidetes bacterium]|nr:MAG: aspartate racemase [Bacteroidota bacterium]
MKTIGLLGGMTWHSTLEYYRLFNEFTNKKLGGEYAAKVLIYSFNFRDLRSWQLENTELLTEQLALQAKKLETAGADIILIGANTMHEYYQKVQNALSIPVLHIGDAVGMAIKQYKLKKIALLGTKYTMQGDFYKNKLAEYDIETIIPSNEEQKITNDIIYNELVKGQIVEDSKQAYLKIINRMKKTHDIEGVILGCTEIPLLIKPEDTVLKTFNTTEIHALSAVNFALGNK